MSGHGRGRWVAMNEDFSRAVYTSTLSRRLRSLKAATSSFALAFAAGGVAAAHAQDVAVPAFGSHEVVLSSTLMGVLAIATACAIGLIRARARAEEAVTRLNRQSSENRARIDLLEGILDTDDQVVVSWGVNDAPLVSGLLDDRARAPRGRAEFLAFGTWLTPEAAADLERALTALRKRGEVFQLSLPTRSGTHLEAVGRTAGGRAVVRFRDLTGERLRYAELSERHRRLGRDVEAMRALLEAMPAPVWLKSADGQLAWINAAYAQAVDAADLSAAVASGTELLDAQGRARIVQERARAPVGRATFPIVVAGQRRMFDVIEVGSANGTAGIAVDVSELDRTRSELKRTIEFHARTLDQLATAVAIFGADKRLQFYNAAYRALFGLDAGFLDGGPDDGVVLDTLRAARRLPEQADWRSWKREILSAYQSVEAKEHWWHLPDGQTLRVIANPHPQGGVTYVYENVTERLDLEKRYNALIRVQRETLDHLAEAVAVFGSDGRLRLSNPAFATIWRLAETTLAAKPHVNDVIAWCSALHDDADAWVRLRAAVTGLADNRTRANGRMLLKNGSVVDWDCVPLPDGATMVTFIDVTDSVNVEHALRDKNEALIEADKIKTDFVGLVSYELRSPLNVISGFAHLLADPKIGTLNDKQLEYADHIQSSSESLRTLIDDILEIAGIDAGIIKIEPEPVDTQPLVGSVLEALKDRVAEAGLLVDVRIAPLAGTITADPNRLRQILYNLVSNAIRFSHPRGRVEIELTAEEREHVLTVRDTGSGIPADQLAFVFDRFYTRRQGQRRGGAGLGLALVKSFVELHGGSVAIESAEGQGTAVTCRFPRTPTDHLTTTAA